MGNMGNTTMTNTFAYGRSQQPRLSATADIFEGGFDDDNDNDDNERYWDADEEDIVANKTYDDYYDWNTNDEVEEANRADNIIKMIEGDYT